MSFLKIKPFFRGYEVTGLRRLQGYEIAKSSIYLATTGINSVDIVNCSVNIVNSINTVYSANSV